MLYPALPEKPTAEQAADVAKRKLVALHFGGKPRGGGDLPAMPQQGMPAPPPAPATAPTTPTTPKKKREGC